MSRLSWHRRAFGAAALAVAVLELPRAALAQNAAPVPPAALAAQDWPEELRAFYAARGFRPLWVADGAVIPAATALLDLIRSGDLDGVKPRKVRESDLRKALGRAESGDLRALLRAEVAASRALVAYVQAMRATPRGDMIYESPALAPAVPTAAAVLEMAARAPSLDAFVRTMGWMHPYYAPLRARLAAAEDARDPAAEVLRANLARVRAIPPLAQGRYVLVDAAGAVLTMFEDGRPVGRMRVVVGKPEMPTPLLAGFLRSAVLNPYWNIPPDLVRARIAPNVLSRGTAYLKDRGYQVLSGWDGDAAVIDPAKVDWNAVAAGATEVRVRQLPGGDNFMGRVKFAFPNAQGIYLHDTPEKALMKEDERQFSSGCVRLEDASRLGRWLTGRALPRAGRKPEQRVDLPQPVPVYITYLTAAPGADGAIEFRPDVYALDGGAGARGDARTFANAR